LARQQEAAVEGLCSALAGLSCAPGTPVLDGDATRAVLFVKLGELARSRAAPSPSLLRLLAALINDGRLPALPACVADAPCLAALADAALGSGEQLPALSPSDRAALLAGSAPSVALAALAVARARKVVAVAEAVSCLSCEARAPASRTGYLLRSRSVPQALQSNVTGFEAEAAEACPHKHDVLVAAELCALLVRPAASPACARRPSRAPSLL
jgi:histidine ammonia-lyase